MFREIAHFIRIAPPLLKLQKEIPQAKGDASVARLPLLPVS